ncbi:hypothetical protein [Burkholderia sp. AU45388]|uniref:hypothetical protein n=1 Tax=Burkholderia sp. AU45388 TaxID=3059206 RepID=UPI00264D2E7E|nr:hypothetical protein [Burkholderia sp. AU45388]MDN7430552.1 hypothetical protein [Burkholderia sp. AU45388]
MKKLDRAGAWDPLIATFNAQFEPPEFDAELVKCLGLAHVDTLREFRRCAPRFVIGVRTDAGDLYRLIGAYITPDARQVANWFLDNGFTDEIGMDAVVIEGCDHIFRRHA